jgi:hypothetical protein
MMPLAVDRPSRRVPDSIDEAYVNRNMCIRLLKSTFKLESTEVSLWGIN